jgi:DNA methyltransferase 1-associated protein 1
VKKERNFKKKVDPWIWNGFTNPAREDRLKLHHWTKEEEKDEVYPFARFNRKVEIIRYTEEEYDKVVAPLSNDWSKAETDHLLELCEQYSLRFIIIADRFESNFENNKEPNIKKRDAKAKGKAIKIQKFHERTVDEIKDRYY